MSRLHVSTFYLYFIFIILTIEYVALYGWAYSPMFRIQWKAPPTPQSPQKWVTKAMVTIRNPMVWGRLLQADKERVITEEMRTTTVNQ